MRIKSSERLARLQPASPESPEEATPKAAAASAGDVAPLPISNPHNLPSWRQGVSLDIRSWLTPKDGKTPAIIVSVAHLDDEERTLVLGVLLEEILAYTRSLPGTRHLRTLVVFDEVYGMLPPHPASPPTKRPTVA